MRGKYSPTISERYIDHFWWFKNGGGYGLLADGLQMTDTYFDFDHEGFDQFGYGPTGRDRAGHTMKEYLGSSDLFSEIASEYSNKQAPAKSVSDYWNASMQVAAMLENRFTDVPLVLPQERRPEEPHIRIAALPQGGYGVRLELEDAADAPRSLEIRFDDGTGGGSNTKTEWSVNVISTSGGETRKAALCMVDGMPAALAFASEAISSYDPDRMIHDVRIMESGDGTVYLEAAPRGMRISGDILGCVYAPDPAAAIEVFASRYEAGGAMHRLAARTLRRLSATQTAHLSAEPELSTDAMSSSASRPMTM